MFIMEKLECTEKYRVENKYHRLDCHSGRITELLLYILFRFKTYIYGFYIRMCSLKKKYIVNNFVYY